MESLVSQEPETFDMKVARWRMIEEDMKSPDKSLENYEDCIRFLKECLDETNEKRVRNWFSRRLIAVYDEATEKFPQEYDMLLEYFRFSTTRESSMQTLRIADIMMKRFPEKPEVFVVTAEWYISIGKFTRAELTYSSGLKLFPSHVPLHVAAIKCECVKRNKNKSVDEEIQMRTDISIYKRVKRFVDVMLPYAKDHKHVSSVLELLENYKFAEDLQKIIIDWLLKNHQNNEKVWDLLAMREYCDNDDNSPSGVIMRFNKCNEKYKQGLKTICPARKMALFNKYFSFLTGQVQRGAMKSLVETTVAEAMKQAKADPFIVLEKEHYLRWSKIVEPDDKCEEIVKMGLAHHPNCAELWLRLLHVSAQKENVEGFNRIFRRAIAQLGDQSLDIYRKAILYHIIEVRYDTVEALFKEASEQPFPISDYMKGEYLDWIAVTRQDFPRARIYYDSVAEKKPYCKCLHTKMNSHEECEIVKDTSRILKIWKLAHKQFPLDADCTVGLMRCYLDQRSILQSNTFDVEEQVKKLYFDAEKSMQPGMFLPLYDKTCKVVKCYEAEVPWLKDFPPFNFNI